MASIGFQIRAYLVFFFFVQGFVSKTKEKLEGDKKDRKVSTFF